ncbi:hypothetical protein X801_02180, partial [Opisthorchis viverrini]
PALLSVRDPNARTPARLACPYHVDVCRSPRISRCLRTWEAQATNTEVGEGIPCARQFSREMPHICLHGQFSVRDFVSFAGIRINAISQVTASHEWAAVYASMGFPLGCIESGHGLRSIYQRFLEPYERCQRMASRTDELEPAYVDTDSQDSDLTSKGSKPTYSMNYLDSVPNHLRAGWNLSTELVDQFDYSSLEYALRSNLPNELDFALNSMLLMSSQPNGFSLHKNVRLLTLLLESVGISNSQPSSHNSDSETVLSRRFSDFWHANVLEKDGRKFLSPAALT